MTSRIAACTWDMHTQLDWDFLKHPTQLTRSGRRTLLQDERATGINGSVNYTANEVSD
jgi:hypothetical protein